MRLTQEQIDTLVRKHKGRNAVEEVVTDARDHQIYLLSNGDLLKIDKDSGHVFVVGSAEYYASTTAFRRIA